MFVILKSSAWKTTMENEASSIKISLEFIEVWK